MTRSPSQSSPALGSGKATWRRRLLNAAQRLGVTVSDVRPGTVLLSRSARYVVQDVVPDRHFLVSRGASPARVLRLDRGVCVVAGGRHAPSVRAESLAGTGGWLVGTKRLVTEQVADGSWFVGRRAAHHAALDATTWVFGTRPLGQQALDDTTWLVRSGHPAEPAIDAAEIGTRGWLVSRRQPSPQADLSLESQALKHLAGRHVAWLLRRYQVDCVLDVGANVGQFGSELRHNGYQGTIVSFEPVPSFADAVEDLAAGDDDWTVHRTALGSRDGTIPIRVQHSLSSALTSTEYGRRRFQSLQKFADDEQIDVPLRRLDGVLDEVMASLAARGIGSPRIFLKMDTQGFDLEVFAGLGERVRDIVGLQSEVALLLIYEGMPRMAESVGVYEAAGFEITGLFPVTREPDGRVIEYDCMMVRPEAFPA
jgi:FkbM family methyltransferase